MKPRTGKLEDEYAWATECQLATLSHLCMVKSSALSEITRQRSIAYHMLKTCQEHASEITWEYGQRREYGRVQDILDSKLGTLDEVLTRWTQDQFMDEGRRKKWRKSFDRIPGSGLGFSV